MFNLVTPSFVSQQEVIPAELLEGFYLDHLAINHSPPPGIFSFVFFAFGPAI
jgi:hypothetical protein